jgi:transglutaminase-like putative cysteine protease
VSSVATLERRAAPPVPQPPVPGPAPERDSQAARIAAFAALAAFGSVHWARLVANPPGARAAAWVAIAVAAASALTLLGRIRSPGVRAVAGTAVALAGLAGGLFAAGLPARLLLPGHFGELLDGLDRGLAGLGTADFPYDGPDPWVRLSLLLGAPLLLGVAAAVGFWPHRSGARVRRGAALVLLLLLYGMAVTEHDPGHSLPRGLALLGLVGAWLWLPRLSPRQLVPAAGIVAAAGLFALPLAAKLDAQKPWWDYRSWDWFGGGKRVSFQWEHSYGPLDWPRKGTTLLYAKSDRPHYWKAETLDRFDGFRWLRSHDNEGTRAAAELPQNFNPQGRSWNYYEYNPRWDDRARFTVRALSSDFVVGMGTTYSVLGAPTVGSADGTTITLTKPLERGDTYTVRGYVPDPTARQMRGAPAGYPEAIGQYTAIFLPRRGETAFGNGLEGDAARSAQPPPVAVFPPLRGAATTGSPGAYSRLSRSPYGRMYRLARRLAAGSPTAYDAVRRIQDHLRRNYAYDEKVPSHAFPLAAFLFKDRAGYCQQFSGAMALMLRMVGIPARVASGFAPGSYNGDTREYRVRDLDAHSWVEVYFAGIGWVTFDPTPPATPAERPSLGPEDVAATGNARNPRGGGAPSGGNRPAGAPGAGGGDSGATLQWWAAPLILALLGALSAGVAALRSRGRGGNRPGALVDAQLRELRAALPRLGLPLAAGTTLLALERRLGRLAGPAAASYAAGLRSHRYGAMPDGLPGREDRRALRRELTRRGSLRTRLLGFVAFPPGGPRRR